MPKKKSTFISRFFVWDAATQTWSQSNLTRTDEKLVKYEHWKTVAGRLWAVCSHPSFPGVYFGTWESDGLHVPPYSS